jgi:hypothetical protein
MYRLKRLRQIRELSLYLFGGVPETPKAVYETDTQGFSEERNSHSRTAASQQPAPTSDGEIVAKARYDERTGVLDISRVGLAGDDTATRKATATP